MKIPAIDEEEVLNKAADLFKNGKRVNKAPYDGGIYQTTLQDAIIDSLPTEWFAYMHRQPNPAPKIHREINRLAELLKERVPNWQELENRNTTWLQRVFRRLAWLG